MTSTEQVGQAFLARLGTITNLTVYHGKVGDDPPRDEAGLVKPYAVLYTAGGRAFSDRLGYKATNLASGGQVTCAAGTPRGCDWAVDHVRAALTGFELIAGSGKLREPFDPGPARRDDTVPGDLRWYVPLLFSLATTT